MQNVKKRLPTVRFGDIIGVVYAEPHLTLLSNSLPRIQSNLLSLSKLSTFPRTLQNSAHFPIRMSVYLY